MQVLRQMCRLLSDEACSTLTCPIGYEWKAYGPMGPKFGGWTATIIISWIPADPSYFWEQPRYNSVLTILDLLRHLFTSCFMGFSKQLKLARLCQNSQGSGLFFNIFKSLSPEILHLPWVLWRWRDLVRAAELGAGISSAPWGGHELRSRTSVVPSRKDEKRTHFFETNMSAIQHHTAIGCGHATCLPGTILAVCSFKISWQRETDLYNHEHSWDSWEIIWDTFNHCICGYLHVGKMVMHELTW